MTKDIRAALDAADSAFTCWYYRKESRLSEEQIKAVMMRAWEAIQEARRGTKLKEDA